VNDVTWEVEVRRVERTPEGKKVKVTKRIQLISERQIVQSIVEPRRLIGSLAEMAFFAVRDMS